MCLSFHTNFSKQIEYYQVFLILIVYRDKSQNKGYFAAEPSIGLRINWSTPIQYEVIVAEWHGADLSRGWPGFKSWSRYSLFPRNSKKYSSPLGLRISILTPKGERILILAQQSVNKEKELQNLRQKSNIKNRFLAWQSQCQNIFISP